MRSDHQLTIKNALPSDFDFILRSHMLSSAFYHDLHNVTPGCIVELSYKSAYEAGRTRDYKHGHPPPEIQNLKDEINAEINNLIACFRLFKLGSVDRMLLHWNPISILEGMHFDSVVKDVSIPLYRYTLTEDEIHQQLGEFVKKIKPLIPQKLNIEKKGIGIDADIPLYIALQSYFDSLSDVEGVEHQISSAMMCLEALFLTDNMEVSHKLRLRVAGLLKFADLVPLNVYKDVTIAYSLRSAFVHGSWLMRKELRKISTSDRKALAKKVTDYARRSLLVFLQLKQLVDEKGIYKSNQGLKHDIINMIDESLLDRTKCSELEAIIKKNCYYRK